MKTRYDIVIAGGGPSGSTAGYLLSKSGLKVLIIDKGTFPRKKLCAGLLTLKAVKLLERVFNEEASSLKAHGVIDYEADYYKIFCKNKVITERTSPAPFRFVNREVYDSFLIRKAVNAGAALLEADTVRSIDILKSSVKTASGKEIEAGVIIGADGVNSRIRRSFPSDLFGRADWGKNLAVGHEAFISREKASISCDCPQIYFDVVDQGYAWIFPNSDKLKIGLCALNQNNRKEILNAFREFMIQSGVKIPLNAIKHSYLLPYGNYLPAPVFRNVLLVGDAAGFADPLLGEGIFFAQRSAELAAKAIKGALSSINEEKIFHSALSDAYCELLKKHIFTEFEYAGKIRQSIFTYLNRPGYLPLKVLMKIFGNRPIEAVHGMRSYNWMKKLDNGVT